MTFARPPIYALTHFGLGFLAAFVPLIGVLAVAYQLTQLYFGVRFFVFEGTYRQGNSVRHTGKKLLEMALGFALGLLWSHHRS